jgi:hypothetical protein
VRCVQDLLDHLIGAGEQCRRMIICLYRAEADKLWLSRLPSA